MTVSTSFTARGVGTILTVRAGSQFSYDLSGTFVATMVLEKQERNRGEWRTVISATTTASGTLVAEEPGKDHATYRWRCALYTSGTAVTAITELTSDAAVALHDSEGATLLSESEDGLEVPLGKVLTAQDASLTDPKLRRRVINVSGSTIGVDKLVAITGLDATSGRPTIVLADADVAAHDDVWVTTAEILTTAEGTVTKGPTLSAANLNTNSASAAGDPVYLSTTAGGFAHTAPTGATARVQPAGFVVVKSATVGQILWLVSPLRSVGTNELQAASVTRTRLASGFAKVSVVTGEDETTTHQITVTGMAVGDEVVAVLVLTTAASIATLAAHAGTLTAAADKITPGTEVDNTGNQYLVFWTDLT
jgi:hypothetical protein